MKTALRRLFTWNGDFTDWMLVASLVWLGVLYVAT